MSSFEFVMPQPRLKLIALSWRAQSKSLAEHRTDASHWELAWALAESGEPDSSEQERVELATGHMHDSPLVQSLSRISPETGRACQL